MSVNLSKHRDSLSCAWKDVLNEKTETNWALFGYEGQTNDLKVVSKGSQGIEELTEDLNSGKIMYAFIKIDDPKTSLPKFVLINWQGEGANTVRKGICANHLRDVEKFFTGAHVTINARTEEEVEPDLIINKVSKSGSAYSFKAPRSDTTGPTDPVGSNYKRINPFKEINATERDQFWMNEEREERERVEKERKRKEAERVQRDEEVKQRELKEAAQREAKANIRNNQIAQINEAEMIASQNNQKLHQVEAYTEEEEAAVNQSEVLRQQRKQEAQELIAQRTIDARSIFERHTSAGQIKRTPEKPVRNSLLKAQVQANDIKPDSVVVQQIMEQQSKITEDQQSDDESNQFSTIKRSPRDAEKKGEFNDQINEAKEDLQIAEDTSYSNNHNPSQQEVQHITEQQFVDEVIYQDLTEGLGLQARALYDYQAADDTEITFDPGDVITNIDQVDEGWWQGLGPDGTYGLFPANYVELI